MNKKIVQGLLLATTLIFGSCTDQLEEKYYNPEKSTTMSIPGFFTSALNSDRVRPSYWNVRTFLEMQPGVYAQTNYFGNGNTAYQQADSYCEQYWNDFYGRGIMSLYRAMEVTYANLPDADKKNQEIFMKAVEVVLYDRASQMVDLWGDIPFSEAGSLETNSTITNAKFDDSAELYATFIAGLDECATYFASASTTADFSKYDILLSGNVKKWQQYANSLRLRLLMRMSNANENTAKTEVLEMLSKPASYPLVDGAMASNYNPANVDVLLFPLTTYTDNLNSALSELNCNWAPDYLLNKVMAPSNDPRLPIFFDNTSKGYRAMPVESSTSWAEANYADYCYLDSTTFVQNAQMPGFVMTSSEVNFLKAEAYQRWGNSSDAKTAFETAVKQSVSFYYYVNNLNSAGLRKESKPSDSEIEAFIESGVSYSGTDAQKLALISTQKWLHFGLWQANQAWAEYRRTDVPALTFPSEGKLAGYTTPPTRLIYPSGEVSNNSENYKIVAGKDTRSTKLFWDVK